MFRILEKKDKEKFVKMVKEFYSSDAVINSIPDENIENTFKEAMSSSTYVKVYIIEVESRCAGYGLLSFTYSNEAGGLVVWIEELYIRENFRGRGLGGKFLDFIEKQYSDKAKRLRLEVSLDNESVAGLYLKKGYSVLEYKQMVNDNISK